MGDHYVVGDGDWKDLLLEYGVLGANSMKTNGLNPVFFAAWKLLNVAENQGFTQMFSTSGITTTSRNVETLNPQKVIERERTLLELKETLQRKEEVWKATMNLITAKAGPYSVGNYQTLLEDIIGKDLVIETDTKKGISNSKPTSARSTTDNLTSGPDAELTRALNDAIRDVQFKEELFREVCTYPDKLQVFKTLYETNPWCPVERNGGG